METKDGRGRHEAFAPAGRVRFVEARAAMGRVRSSAVRAGAVGRSARDERRKGATLAGGREAVPVRGHGQPEKELLSPAFRAWGGADPPAKHGDHLLTVLDARADATGRKSDFAPTRLAQDSVRLGTGRVRSAGEPGTDARNPGAALRERTGLAARRAAKRS